MNQLAPHLHSCSADILTEKGIPVSRSSPLPLSTGGGARPAGSDAEDPYHPAPIRCFLILPALLCLLVLCACSTVEENRRINKIKTFTSEYFTTLLASTPENQELWDMQSFTIFGYGSIPFFEIPIASTGVRIHIPVNGLAGFRVQLSRHQASYEVLQFFIGEPPVDGDGEIGISGRSHQVGSGLVRRLGRFLAVARPRTHHGVAEAAGHRDRAR